MKEKTQTSIVQKFGKNIFSYLPSKVFPAFITLLAIPVITRLFEPSHYGNYMLTVTTVGFLALIPSHLLGTSAVRFFSLYQQQNRLNEFYTTLIKLSLACVISIAAIFLGLLYLVRNGVSLELYQLMMMGVPLFILTSIFGILLHLLNAKQKASTYSCFSIWQVGGGLALGVFIVLFLRLGVEGLLWGAIGALLIALPLLVYSALGNLNLKEPLSKSIAIEMGKYGGPLIIGGLAAWILSLSDRYIIGLYRGSYEVGLYSASYEFSEHSLSIILSLSMLAGYPLIVNIWEAQGKDATQTFVRVLSRYYLLISFPAAVGISILAKPIIAVFTAPAYHEGYRIVPLIVFGSLLLGLQWWAQVGLLLYKKTYIISSVVLGAGFLNIGLNILLVPIYGYIAAAATTLFSYSVLLLLMSLVSQKMFTWRFPFTTFAKICCSSFIMAIPVFIIGNSLTISTSLKIVFGILVGLFVYIFMLYILKEPIREDFQNILGLKTVE